MEQKKIDENKIIQIIAETLRKDVNAISGETQIVQDLGIKSLTMISILAQVEDEFDVTLTLNEVAMAKTVGELADKINEQA